jgi:hypothetical protein
MKLSEALKQATPRPITAVGETHKTDRWTHCFMALRDPSNENICRLPGHTVVTAHVLAHAFNMLPKLVEAIQYHIGEHSSAAEADTARAILDEVLAEAENVPGI